MYDRMSLYTPLPQCCSGGDEAEKSKGEMLDKSNGRVQPIVSVIGKQSRDDKPPM